MIYIIKIDDFYYVYNIEAKTGLATMTLQKEKALAFSNFATAEMEAKKICDNSSQTFTIERV